MSEVEIITDGGRRRRWSSAEKLRIVEATLDGSESISAVARRNGVAPNLMYLWRKLMVERGSVAVIWDDGVTSNKKVRQMEDRIRELERQTAEIHIRIALMTRFSALGTAEIVRVA
ncbi:transposase [Roseovarius sp. D22-M7]|uniref:transposase n=1 Tax=Roseovarius sp. D22-M7 TaxID=3127116 RepID=UPI003010451D